MKREFIVAIRNDQGQLLILETPAFMPVFPSGSIEASQSALKAITGQVRDETGLEISGLHLTSVDGKKALEVHRYTAFCAGGKLFDFRLEPHSKRFRSASWMTPSLIFRFTGLPNDIQALVNELGWIHIRDELVVDDGRPVR